MLLNMLGTDIDLSSTKQTLAKLGLLLDKDLVFVGIKYKLHEGSLVTIWSCLSLGFGASWAQSHVKPSCMPGEGQVTWYFLEIRLCTLASKTPSIWLFPWNDWSLRSYLVTTVNQFRMPSKGHHIV